MLLRTKKHSFSNTTTTTVGAYQESSHTCPGIFAADMYSTSGANMPPMEYPQQQQPMQYPQQPQQQPLQQQPLQQQPQQQHQLQQLQHQFSHHPTYSPFPKLPLQPYQPQFPAAPPAVPATVNGYPWPQFSNFGQPDHQPPPAINTRYVPNTFANIFSLV